MSVTNTRKLSSKTAN